MPGMELEQTDPNGETDNALDSGNKAQLKAMLVNAISA